MDGWMDVYMSPHPKLVILIKTPHSKRGERWSSSTEILDTFTEWKEQRDL